MKTLIVLIGILTALTQTGFCEDSPRELVRYIQGDEPLSYARVLQLSNAHTSILIGMLHSPGQGQYIHRIVYALGVIGGSNAAPHLINLLEKDFKGELTRAQFKAAVFVPSALGSLAERGDQRALRYLKEAADPQTWAKKDVPWKARGLPGGVALGHALASASILGLGYAANPDAESYLKELSARKDLPANLKGGVAQALEDSKQIRKKGKAAFHAEGAKCCGSGEESQ